MLAKAETDTGFLKGDETLIYGYDSQTKRESFQWKWPNSPKPKKAGQVKSNVKVMLITFFDSYGIFHRECVPQDQTVHQHFYLEVMRRIGESVKKNRPESWKNVSWMLHKDNAPAHTSLLIRCHREAAANALTV
jgi:hypothetical protein